MVSTDRDDRFVTFRRRIVPFVLGFALVLAWLFVLASAIAPASGAPNARVPGEELDWDGVWSTTGIHGNIKLNQKGKEVNGHYRGADGSLGGTVDDDNVLEGSYNCDGRGKFKIHFKHGTRRQEFKGWYKPKGGDKVDWEGSRQ